MQSISNILTVLLLFWATNFLYLIKTTAEETKCGIPNKIFPSSKIVGGYEVGYYKYPWYAALYSDDENIMCGGTLIGPKIVLTAAHCYKPFIADIIRGKIKPQDIFAVKLGINNKCINESTQKAFHAERAVIHDDYIEEQPYYDIAVIILKESARKYQPVCLPKQIMSSSIRPREGLVQGFGRLKPDNPTIPCLLQESRVLIYSDLVCWRMLNSTGNNGNDLTHAFCAGYLSGGIDSCQGDSGGPLVTIDNNGRYTLQGIVSFGFGCAQKGLLGIYTDVSHFLPWIDNATGLNLGTSETLEGENGSTNSGVILHSPITHSSTTTEISVGDFSSIVVVVVPPEGNHTMKRRRRRRRRRFRRKFHRRNGENETNYVENWTP